MPHVVCEAILARLARIHLTALRFLCAANTKAPSDDPVRRGLFRPILPNQNHPRYRRSKSIQNRFQYPEHPQKRENPMWAGRSFLNVAFIYAGDDLLSHTRAGRTLSSANPAAHPSKRE